MLPLSHPPEKYQSVVCNSVLHDEEIQLPFRRPLTTITIDSNDRYMFYRSFYSINNKAATQEKQEGYEVFVSCFQLVNAM